MDAAVDADKTALLTVAQMREADERTIAAGTPGTTLMQHAGDAVAQAIARRWPPRPLTVLCGPGNNGGDGFVAARLLAEQGWPVTVALLGDREALRGDARFHAHQWGGPLVALSPDAVRHARLIVDALFGAGLSRPLPDIAARTLAAARARGVPMVAVDVPSGVDGDTGASLGAVGADLTVTFFRKKPGHLLLPGRTLCGEIEVADIGIAASALAALQPQAHENAPACWLPGLPALGHDTHKYQRGHALVRGGYPMTGAARLAALGAARAGAGLTTVAVPAESLAIYASHLLSVMVQPLAQPADLSALLEDGRHTALLAGPGLPDDPITRDTVLTLLGTGKPCVLDAGALTAFRYDPETLFRAIEGPCVLTPHEGEFQRLFGLDDADKLSRARRAAARSGAVLVLKGADTVIAAPSGLAIINANATSTLATAGSGDVLAGLVTGLLAQGMPAFQAAAAATWLHGDAATQFGPGLIADDLPGLVPGALSRLAQHGQAPQAESA